MKSAICGLLEPFLSRESILSILPITSQESVLIKIDQSTSRYSFCTHRSEAVYTRHQSLLLASLVTTNSRKRVKLWSSFGDSGTQGSTLAKTKQNTRDWKQDEEKQIWPTGEGKNCTFRSSSWRCWTFKYGVQDLYGFKKWQDILGYGSIREWRIEAFFRCNRLLEPWTRYRELDKLHRMRMNQVMTDLKSGFSEKL